MTPTELDHLRSATEDTVAAALKDAYVSVPLSDPVDLLEFYNRMLDVMTGEDEFVTIPRYDLNLPRG